MKVNGLIFLAVAVFFVECNHTFLGRSVNRSVAAHYNVKYVARESKETVKTLDIDLKSIPAYAYSTIQGILAYDMNNGLASLNVTEGGIGADHAKLRMKSERGKSMYFDIYIYV